MDGAVACLSVACALARSLIQLLELLLVEIERSLILGRLFLVGSTSIAAAEADPALDVLDDLAGAGVYFCEGVVVVKSLQLRLRGSCR